MKATRTVIARVDNKEIETRNRVREYYRYGFEFFRRSEKIVEIIKANNGDAFEIFKTLYPYSEQSITISATLDMTQPFQLFRAEWSHKLEMAKLLYEQQGQLNMFMQEQTPQVTMKKWDKCLKVYDLRVQEAIQKQAKKQGAACITLNYNNHMSQVEPIRTKHVDTEYIAKELEMLEPDESLKAAYNAGDIRKKLSEYHTEAKRLIKSAVAGTFPK